MSSNINTLKFESLGDELRTIREECKVGLNELAKKINWDKGRLSKYENNKLALTVDAIDQIAQGLGIPSPVIVIRFLKKLYPVLSNPQNHETKLLNQLSESLLKENSH
jgi:transcriptional regulator with XRE-family HTH domain